MMKPLLLTPRFFTDSAVLAVLLVGCSASPTDPAPATGGSTSTGGSISSGGALSSGGANTGGATGGVVSSGGSSSGGVSNKGGAAGSMGTVTGGAGSGGIATGGTSTGGSTTGGSTANGGAAGGAGRGGAAGGAGRGGAAGSANGGASNGGAAGGTAMGGSGGAGTSLSAGCGKAPGIASSMYNNGNPIAITAASKQRRYILSVPANYDNTKPYNLVIAWHQLDGNDKQMYQQNFYWLKDIAEVASSTIFVAPNGEKNGAPCTGNSVAESGCGWPDSGGSNVALADAVVAEVTANFCIDKNRIFANGWSYGGSMSYRTACSRPLGGTGADWGVRGVAIYNGAAQLSGGNCNPSKAVALYVSHGTNDNVLNYDGGVSMATTYAKLNGCTSMTPAKASGNHVCTNFMGCTADYPVEFCSFVGQHTPDPPREGGQRWQPQAVWKFFSAL
jgi:poly(3-hydroxybutyrate) depolymerase